MKPFSSDWKSSKNPRKQRKYRLKAPLHIRKSLIKAHLAKELRTKLKKRSAIVRTGDTVSIVRGQFKGKKGKVKTVNTTRYKLTIEGAEMQKRDGSKLSYPVDPSNVIITELVEDKKRGLQ